MFTSLFSRCWLLCGHVGGALSEGSFVKDERKVDRYVVEQAEEIVQKEERGKGGFNFAVLDLVFLLAVFLLAVFWKTP